MRLTGKTRQERHNKVIQMAALLGLTVERSDSSSWHVWGTDGYRGLLTYNQRNGLWKVLDSSGKAHFGEPWELLSLLAKDDPGEGTGEGSR